MFIVFEGQQQQQVIFMYAMHVLLLWHIKDMTRSLVEVLNVMCWCISQLMVSSVFQLLGSLVSLIIKQFISLPEGFHMSEKI